MSETKTVSSVVEELKAGFTIRAIVLAIIFGIIGLFANIATWWGLGISLEPVFAGRVGSAIYPPYGLVFILVLVSLFMKALTVQEIAVITTIAFVTADSPFVVGAFLQFIFAGTYLTKTNPNVQALLKYSPPLWTPGDYDLIAPAWAGGAAVPLGRLLPYLAFWMIMIIIWCLMMVFQAALIRLQLIKKERLPFPMMIPINEMLSQHQKGTFASYMKKLPFLAGIVLGCIIGILGALNYIIKFTTVFFAFGQFYQQWFADLMNSISRNTIQSWWMFIPADAAIMYLAPLDVLSSIVIWLFIFQILFPLILVNTGMITPNTNPCWTGPFPWSAFSYYWAPLAVGIWTIIFGYKTYAESIKKKEFAPGELPNSLVWYGFAATWLLWLILWVIFGANVLPLLVGFITWFLYTTGMVAVCGATGTWVAGGDAVPARYLAWGVGTGIGLFPASGAAAKTQSAWATMAGVSITASMGGVIHQNTHTAWAYTSTYTMVEPAKVKETDILKSHILGILITAVIGVLVAVYIIYGTGIGRLKAWGLGSGANITGFQVPWVVADAAPPAGFHWWMFPLAIVVVGILFFLRSRFAWFFFSPYALFFHSGMWLINAGLAWVLKLITLKVFGAKAYEEVGVPVAIGFMVGVTLMATIIMGVNAATGGISVGPTGY